MIYILWEIDVYLLFSVSKLHEKCFISRRNFRYVYFVTTYLIFRRE